MINSLYDKFKSWSKNGSVFIISDTHFNDSDCKLMDKNWPTADEQLQKIIKDVHKNDTFICLGDVGDIEYIKKIKAYKVLVMGNHDTGRSKYERKVSCQKFSKDKFSRNEAIEKMKELYPDCIYSVTDGYDFHEPFQYWEVKADNKLFDEVYEGPLMIGEKILLSHEPIMGLEWCLNIHGHDHSDSIKDKYHLNLASNVCDYTPLNLGSYIKLNGLSNIKSLHRITVDKAGNKKK